MKKIVLILTVMLSVGCERAIDSRIEHLEVAMKGLRSQNCALTNKIYQQEYDSCVALWKASQEAKQDSHQKKASKEIERLRKLVNKDMENSIVILPINDSGFVMYSGSQCFRRLSQDCGDE